MKTKLAAATLTLLAAASLAAGAQTLYKLIDKNGKITYSNEKPKEYDGEVIPLTIDPNANTATLPKAAPGGLNNPAATAAAKNQAARMEGAQERLTRARAALQEARDNPREGDFDRVGTTSGFTRPVASEQYLQRLSHLEDEVRQAEDAVAKLEKPAPR
jgi:hypothetical protein